MFVSPLIAVAVLAGLLVVATGAGLLLRRTGTLRGTTEESVTAQDLGVASIGSSATLLQLSTSFCSPCRTTARLLTGVVANRDGVAHIEVDLEQRPELADRFRVLQTPTTLLLDADGVVRGRIGGVPNGESLDRELDALVKGAHV